VLVFRFSALGDVAMTIPVIRQVLDQHPEVQIHFVSNKAFAPLFNGIDRLHFYPADLKGKHKGVAGLFRLFRELKHAANPDALADLHQVVRTKLLRLYFGFSGGNIAMSVLDKGREEKAALTRKKFKRKEQLPSMTSRYAEVFSHLGLHIHSDPQYIAYHATDQDGDLQALRQQGFKLIGIAPFAKHPEKMYPEVKMKEVIRSLAADPQHRVFLFGGGPAETALLAVWEKEIAGVRSMAGKLSLEAELKAIAALHVMVSMDSANMHLASLAGVPVVSIWGATHPYAGFYGWGQDPENAVQAELFCRPCSVFGNKPCYRVNRECLQLIGPDQVLKKIQALVR
jgi:ADP-heptose:LPS heptosyltransferase